MSPTAIPGKMTLRKDFSPVGLGGDNVYEIEVSGTVYRVHVFTTVGESEFIAASPIFNLEYLVVGGGGSSLLGGGGGGGVRNGLFSVNIASYSVVVGAGGAAVTYTASQANNGDVSSIFSVEAAGGGGGSKFSITSQTGLSGGCGGGVGASAGGTTLVLTGGSGNTPFVSPSQGFNGGNVNNFSRVGSGGGGAGQNGSSPTANSIGAPGGNGVLSNITGSSIYYGGGGGGGGSDAVNDSSPASGGLGGGGNGGLNNSTAGSPNTGGGGGGGWALGSVSRAGGSGIVIVRYAI